MPYIFVCTCPGEIALLFKTRNKIFISGYDGHYEKIILIHFCVVFGIRHFKIDVKPICAITHIIVHISQLPVFLCICAIEAPYDYQAAPNKFYFDVEVSMLIYNWIKCVYRQQNFRKCT